MFDVAWDELALIAAVAVIVIGPKDLPKVMRQAGRWARRARELAAEFQRGVDDMMREAELDELRQQVNRVGDTAQLRRQVEAAIDPDGKIAESLAPPHLDIRPPDLTVKAAEPAPPPASASGAAPEAAAPPSAEQPAATQAATGETSAADPAEPAAVPFQSPPRPPEP